MSPQGSLDAAGNPKPSEEDQSFVMQVALKCADLGHLSAPRQVHRRCGYLSEHLRSIEMEGITLPRAGSNEQLDGAWRLHVVDRKARQLLPKCLLLRLATLARGSFGACLLTGCINRLSIMVISLTGCWRKLASSSSSSLLYFQSLFMHETSCCCCCC